MEDLYITIGDREFNLEEAVEGHVYSPDALDEAIERYENWLNWKKEALELLCDRIAYYGDEENEDYDEEVVNTAYFLHEDVTEAFEGISRANEWETLKKKVEHFLELY